MRALGRAYPAAVADGIRSVASELDDLMTSSVDLATYADVDVAPRVSAANAGLVNGVILASDQIDDAAARARLAEIRSEADSIRTVFDSNGVPVHGRPAIPAGEAMASIPSGQAASLAAAFDDAYERYPSVVERYARVRPGLEKKADFDLRALDDSVRWLDDNVDQVRDAASTMAARAQEGPSVGMNLYLFDRAKAWVGAVNQADEAIKRYEAIADGKRAEPARAGGGTPWGLIAAGGALLVALVAVAVTD